LTSVKKCAYDETSDIASPPCSRGYGVMKKALSYLTIFSLLCGCTPAPYIKSIETVYESPTKSGNEITQKYYDRISDNLKNSLSNNDPINWYWQIALLVAYDSNAIIDSDIMSLLEEKEKDFKNDILVEYKKILIDGIKKCGDVPKENDLYLLKYEFMNNSIGDTYKESIYNQTINEIDNKSKSFLKSLISKVSNNAKDNWNKLVLYAEKGDNADIPFVDVYVNIFKYSEQEKYKLGKLLDIYKLYNEDALKVEFSKLKLNDKQREQGKKLTFKLDDTYKAFIRLLNKDQILLWNNIIERAQYHEVLKENLTKRLANYEKIAEWLKSNKGKAESSLTRQDTIKAERAKAINSALLIGLAAGLSAYGSYLSSPRSQTVIQQPTLLGPYKSDAYGPGIHSDGTGRPFTWQPKTSKGTRIFDPTLNVRPDVYGPGTGMDQYGRPVTGKSWP
jgi:hypothetical protein